MFNNQIRKRILVIQEFPNNYLIITINGSMVLKPWWHKKLNWKVNSNPLTPQGEKRKYDKKGWNGQIRKRLTNYLFSIFIPIDFVAEGLAQIIC